MAHILLLCCMLNTGVKIISITLLLESLTFPTLKRWVKIQLYWVPFINFVLWCISYIWPSTNKQTPFLFKEQKKERGRTNNGSNALSLISELAVAQPYWVTAVSSYTDKWARQPIRDYSIPQGVSTKLNWLYKPLFPNKLCLDLLEYLMLLLVCFSGDSYSYVYVPVVFETQIF